MTTFRRLSRLSLACSIVSLALTVSAQTRQIPSGGTGYFTSTTVGALNNDGPELDPAFDGVEHDGGNDAVGNVSINRTLKHDSKPGNVQAPAKSSHPKSNPALSVNFDGLNFYQQRYANGGNQFSTEPPDQGLCAGNGYVLESTNDVLRVYSTTGTALSGVVSLNQFYGYPPAINRSNGHYGQDIADPSCYYDATVQRWFHVVITFERQGTTSALSGKNHLDLAVSQSANPLGVWNIYRIPVQDDGTNGTPNHGCPGGACFGDYPHIGADANGIYITTNEFALFRSGFVGAQIYAISKQALATSSPSVTVFQYNTGDPATNTATGLPGFTVWPAISAGPSPSEFGGTEYLLSSLAVFQDSGVDSRLQLWSLTNTRALNSGGAPALTSSVVNTEPYGIPGYARQPGNFTNGIGKAPGGGNIDFPLGQCLDLSWCATNYILGVPDPYHETIRPLAGNDSRMQEVYYANGKLWSSLGTGLGYSDGSLSDGLAYFVLHPKASGGTPTATVDLQGYLADPNLDMTYGSVAVTQSGRGIISFTATGPDNYPSVGYASLDDKIGAGDPQISAPGVGANDGFTGYFAYGGGPRWGDYGYAAVDGNSIWFAQEYIGQSCNLLQYLTSSPLGSCNATRGALGNWGTRIAKVTP